MNILLTILPVFWPKMPPLGLGYLQSYLDKEGFPAEILDLNNLFYNLAGQKLKKEWLVSCNRALENNILGILNGGHHRKYQEALDKISGYDVVGFSCFKSNFPATLSMAKELKDRKRSIKIILGGPEIARLDFMGDLRRIEKTADFLVVGEGEKPLVDYLKGENRSKIVKFQQLEDHADLPFPRYKGINFSDYPRKDALPLQFSRGCIRKCQFCSERLLFQGFQSRPVKDISEEIKFHKENNNIEYFVFFDSLINGDLKKLESLCDIIIDNFGRVNWEAQIAVRKDMPDSLFEKIKKSGCYNLFVGLESGSDRTLEKMEKGFNSSEAADFFKQLRQAELFFGISMIVGYPGETDADFKESLDFIVRNKGLIPKIEQVNPFTYYDGTKADRSGDYRGNKDSLERMEYFVREIKKRGFKYTNAFLGNLIEKC